MTTPAPAPPNTYTIVLPPGWAQIPLRKGTDQAIGRIVERAFKGHSRDDVATYRREFEQRLRQQVRQARDAAGLDLYLPVGPAHGIPIAASFVVSEVSFCSVETVDPEMIAARLASAEDGSEPVEVDGALAVRTERLLSADPAREVDFPSRRVDYLVCVPKEPDRWLAIAFSTLRVETKHGDESQDSDIDMSVLLVELFDAMMTTFRWGNR